MLVKTTVVGIFFTIPKWSNLLNFGVENNFKKVKKRLDFVMITWYIIRELRISHKGEKIWHIW